MPMWNKLYFQNSNSPIMEHLMFFHDHSMMIIIIATIMTFYIMMNSIMNKKNNRFLSEANQMEIFWTTLPAIMLMFIAIPSLKTLYLMEESMNPSITIKTMGLQWFWNYEYSELKNIKLNSMIMKSNKIRIMNTSNKLMIPSMTPTRMLITSKDVIHSWTIPSLGVKVDAIPGRMNQIFIMIKRPSIMLGQCSEICGAGHSFMPIMLESSSMNMFLKNISLSGWKSISLLNYFMVNTLNENL
uniref:Cytochrome c oxidase subunit 2 n=1 Tax=Riccardoella reaumuri TaxID=2803873 RepID=A0A7R7UNH5_9ACAR|nr:cytochrome oxidase subunit 2 [Riccardoella reaumuri]